MSIFSDYDSEDNYSPVGVHNLESGDYINLEEDTIWDDDEFGELDDPTKVYVVDSFQEGEDEDGQLVWHVVVENNGQEVVLVVLSTHRFYALES